jgi:site-specific DNA recombinase
VSADTGAVAGDTEADVRTGVRSAPPPAPAPRFDTGRDRAVIYLRVSTGTQVQGTSIDSQRDQCRAAAVRHGFTVAGEYVDAGVSGARTARPALDELMAAIMAGQVDAVIIAKLDRLGRSLLHLLTLIGQLDTLGVRVISAGDNIDTKTPAGRMMLQLLGVFAEFERERIRERSADGARRRVAEGGFVSSSPPFGYRAVPDPTTGRVWCWTWTRSRPPASARCSGCWSVTGCPSQVLPRR